MWEFRLKLNHSKCLYEHNKIGTIVFKLLDYLRSIFQLRLAKRWARKKFQKYFIICFEISKENAKTRLTDVFPSPTKYEYSWVWKNRHEPDIQIIKIICMLERSNIQIGFMKKKNFDYSIYHVQNYRIPWIIEMECTFLSNQS